jgi:hypothetical protein
MLNSLSVCIVSVNSNVCVPKPEFRTAHSPAKEPVTTIWAANHSNDENAELTLAAESDPTQPTSSAKSDVSVHGPHIATADSSAGTPDDFSMECLPIPIQESIQPIQSIPEGHPPPFPLSPLPSLSMMDPFPVDFIYRAWSGLGNVSTSPSLAGQSLDQLDDFLQ